MPRHPNGERAMTNAERQRAYMERLRGKQPGSPPPQDEETATLKERITKLEAELADATRSSAGRPKPLPKTQEELLAQRRAAKRTASRTAAAEKYAGEDEKTLQEKLAAAERQLAAARTKITTLTAKVRYFADKSPPSMTKKLHKEVRGLLHPDRAPPDDEKLRKKLERAFQEFSEVKFTFPPD